ncbi:V-type ATP synthase subunit I [Dysosmobacter sp. HCP28S3_G4]|uniref:V-type ATP synthase subunit I n=1 Tax=Dysosmobacter sp. HCP28S3_G4 TaxID=3438938 RepID=UPI003F8C1777
MAIVKMKKLRVIALASDRDALLRQLLRLGCVEISQPDSLLADPQWSALLRRDTGGLTEVRTEMADVNTALEAVKRYGGLKDGLFLQRHPISEKEFLGSGTVDNARAAAGKINGLLRTLTRLQNEEGRMSAQRAGLAPWSGLDVPLERQGTEHVLFRLGVVPGGADVGMIRNELAAADAAAELLEVSADKQQHYLFLLCHRADEEKAMEVLRPRGFSAVTFPEVSGTAAENLRRLDRELEANRKHQADTEAAITGCAGSRDALRLYADRLTAEAAQEENAGRLMTDGTIVFFEGWCPAERLDKVEKLLEEKGCAWEAADPTEEEIPDVPVQLKNNWLTRPLNMVTEMYSLPRYDNVDPNPLMAPFFILFYGIMMADMGYGLLMFLAGLLITRKYRPKGTMGHMFSLMTLCGVSTFIMGALTGGFFGDFLTQIVKLTTGGDFALPALFTPLNDTLMILVGAMALGLVQIVTGMAISFIRKIRAGRYLDALFEEATWWVVFAGIGCMALGVTNLVLYAGIALIFAGPLITGKGFGKIMGIFGSLYNHVTGYFGDILSYARLMALMLAGSVIAQVFNTLGAIPGNVVIFVIISMAGNALNFALNLLGCYVHDLRLQCLEYFGKFYEDGGKPFRPLAINTKYVDIQNN